MTTQSLEKPGTSVPGVVTTTFGSPESRRVCLRYVLRHPVAFREYWTPKVSRRRFWQRYSFSPVALSLDHGDTGLYAGRGGGKSFAILESELVRQAIMRPGEETLLTSLRKVHIVDRMERVIDYLETIPLLRLFLKKVLRSPTYVVELHTGHTIFGVSVGDDPEARMAQGKHASTIAVEEAHQYPLRAWIKLQGAKDPRGCRVLMIGVPDGRLDTPFRKADSAYASFEGRRFHLSRRLDPYFSQRTKAELVSVFGGEDRDAFMQEIDAEWGAPAWSAWDLDAIYRCVDPQLPVVVLEISGKVYRAHALTPEVVCADLPGPERQGLQTRLSMDVGYSQPSEIGVWTYWHERWQLVARVRLVNRMEHDDQARIVNEIGHRYGVQGIGIDTTDGEGRAIAQMLESDLGWTNQVTRVSFNETLLAGWTPDKEEVWENGRVIGIRMLRGLFSQKGVVLPKDEAIPTEFNQEMETRNNDGVTRVVTPSTIHIPEMCRVFAIMEFLATPLVPPDEEDATGFVLCEWGDQPGPWASIVRARV